jgi:2-haloacid dehalogenase
MTKIEHIVFDIGSVLIHWDPELMYLDLIPDADQRRHFLTNICSPVWNVKQDRGRSWQEAEQLLIAEHPQHESWIRAYRQRWIRSVPHAFDDVVEVFENLIASGCDVTLLTNFNQDTYLEARNKFDFLAKARGETVSGRVKLIKPDPLIYEHHNASFALNPATTLFIDDSANNVSAAQKAGWQAIHFAGREGAAKLQSALQDHGVG